MSTHLDVVVHHPAQLGRRSALAVLLAAVAVLACRLVLDLALIPPWQQPDEATHVAIVELRRTRIDLLDGSPDPAREGEILHSMANYDWWKHRGRKTPEPIPERFSLAGDKTAVDPMNNRRPSPYYLIVGRMLACLPRMTVVEDLYVLRTVSAAFSILTLFVVWLGARECLGATGGATVTVLVALHPQFAVVSTAATPDAMVNLLGACSWWQATVAIRRKHLLLPLTAMWLAALGAAFADRMGLPLLVVAFAASVVVMSVRMPFREWKATLMVNACSWWQATVAVRRKHLLPQLAAMWLAALGATIAARMGFPLLVVAFAASVVVMSLRLPFRGWKAVLAVPVIAALAVMVSGISMWVVGALQTSDALRSDLAGGWMPVSEGLDWDFVVRSSSFVLQSWWFSLGWVRYPPPSWWASVTFVLVAIATIGVGRRMRRERDARTRALLGLAMMSIAIYLFAVYWAYVRLGHGAQGKSLYPCLVPCVVLLWAGLEAWVPEPRRMHAAVALVLLVALLDAAVWALVGIPAYATS